MSRDAKDRVVRHFLKGSLYRVARVRRIRTSRLVCVRRPRSHLSTHAAGFEIISVPGTRCRRYVCPPLASCAVRAPTGRHENMRHSSRPIIRFIQAAAVRLRRVPLLSGTGAPVVHAMCGAQAVRGPPLDRWERVSHDDEGRHWSLD
jgi:hypothetical protein